MNTTRWLIAAVALTVLWLLTQFRCGMHATYHDYGPSWRSIAKDGTVIAQGNPVHEVQMRSFVTHHGELFANATIAISNSRSSAWLVLVLRFRDSSASVGSFHPFKDYLDVQAAHREEWHSWNVCLFPPRVWGYLGSDQ